MEKNYRRIVDEYSMSTQRRISLCRRIIFKFNFINFNFLRKQVHKLKENTPKMGQKIGKNPKKSVKIRKNRAKSPKIAVFP